MDEYDLINTMNWIKINHTVLQGQIRKKKKKTSCVGSSGKCFLEAKTTKPSLSRSITSCMITGGKECREDGTSRLRNLILKDTVKQEIIMFREQQVVWWL